MDAAGMLDIIGSIATLDAQHPVVRGGVERRFDGVDVLILGCIWQPTVIVVRTIRSGTIAPLERG
jgi:hypothetical protein